MTEEKEFCSFCHATGFVGTNSCQECKGIGYILPVWDGEYEKDHYWLYPSDGGPRVMCWPNASYMNATDGSGRMWKPADNVRVERIPVDSPAHPTAEIRKKAQRARYVLAAGLAIHRRVEENLTGAGRSSSRVERRFVEEPLTPFSPNVGRKGIQRSAGTVERFATPGRRVEEKGPCTHKFGLAGGFSECSACGIKERRKL